MEFGSYSAGELLRAYSAILDELRNRNVIRSANNPASDLAELLFCRAFTDWTRENNSKAGYDAICPRGIRYQIKSVRLHKPATSRQLSAIRRLPDEPFDYLAGVLFGRTFDVHRAAIVPVAVVRARAKLYGHTNSWTFMLTDDVWNAPTVQDVTQIVRVAAETLEHAR